MRFTIAQILFSMVVNDSFLLLYSTSYRIEQPMTPTNSLTLAQTGHNIQFLPPTPSHIAQVTQHIALKIYNKQAIVLYKTKTYIPRSSTPAGV